MSSPAGSSKKSKSKSKLKQKTPVAKTDAPKTQQQGKQNENQEKKYTKRSDHFFELGDNLAIKNKIEYQSEYLKYYPNAVIQLKYYGTFYEQIFKYDLSSFDNNVKFTDPSDRNLDYFFNLYDCPYTVSIEDPSNTKIELLNEYMYAMELQKQFTPNKVLSFNTDEYNNNILPILRTSQTEFNNYNNRYYTSYNNYIISTIGGNLTNYSYDPLAREALAGLYALNYLRPIAPAFQFIYAAFQQFPVVVDSSGQQNMYTKPQSSSSLKTHIVAENIMLQPENSYINFSEIFTLSLEKMPYIFIDVIRKVLLALTAAHDVFEFSHGNLNCSSIFFKLEKEEFLEPFYLPLTGKCYNFTSNVRVRIADFSNSSFLIGKEGVGYYFGSPNNSFYHDILYFLSSINDLLEKGNYNKDSLDYIFIQGQVKRYFNLFYSSKNLDMKSFLDKVFKDSINVSIHKSNFWNFRINPNYFLENELIDTYTPRQIIRYNYMFQGAIDFFKRKNFNTKIALITTENQSHPYQMNKQILLALENLQSTFNEFYKQNEQFQYYNINHLVTYYTLLQQIYNAEAFYGVKLVYHNGVPSTAFLIDQVLKFINSGSNERR